MSFTLLHRNREIRTDVIALMAADAVVRTRWFALDMIVEFQHLLRAYPHAQAATLAPGFVDSDAETLCQKNHLPPPSCLHADVPEINEYIANIPKKYTQIKPERPIYKFAYFRAILNVHGIPNDAQDVENKRNGRDDAPARSAFHSRVT
jgi:hypothetical protein